MRLDKLESESVEIPKVTSGFVERGRGRALGEIDIKHDIGKDVGKNLCIWSGCLPYPYPRIPYERYPFPEERYPDLYDPYPSPFETEKELLKKAYDVARKIYEGDAKLPGLKTINGWKRSIENYTGQLRQQAKHAAEVIGTAKDNILSKFEKTGLTTHQTKESPVEFQKNAPFVDKLRKNEDGQIVERIQVKFVGRNGEQLLKKLASPRFGKYFDKNVDKIEIPSDYYDEIFSKNLIRKELADLERQLEYAISVGNTDVASRIQSRISRFQKIQQSLLRSRVSSAEARQAVIYPKTYVARLFTKDITSGGLKQGDFAGVSSAAVSTVENVKNVMDGKITPMEAFGDVTKKTAIADGIGSGVGFISEASALAMLEPSHALIRAMAKIAIPAEIISVGIDSFDAIVDYSRGTIDGKELAYDLGASTVSVTGAIAGAKAGTAIGTALLPGAGTVAGALIGLTSGVVGTAVASQAYKTAVELGNSEQAKVLLEKTKELATSTIEDFRKLDTGEKIALVSGSVVGGIAGAYVGLKGYRAVRKLIDTPNKAEIVQKEFNDYFAKNGIPITV